MLLEYFTVALLFKVVVCGLEAFKLTEAHVVVCNHEGTEGLTSEVLLNNVVLDLILLALTKVLGLAGFVDISGADIEHELRSTLNENTDVLFISRKNDSCCSLLAF